MGANIDFNLTGNLVPPLEDDQDTVVSFNLPRKITNVTGGRAVSDGAVAVESTSCTYEALLALDRMRLLSEASLVLTPYTYKEGVLYSLKPTYNGNGDFTVTRATTATRVNSSGLVDLVPYNLFAWSEMFSDASWTKTRASITPNTTSAPDGTLTADSLIENNTTSTHSLSVAVNVVDSSYTVSVYAKANQRNWINITWLSTANASAFFNISNGTLGTIGSAATATITSVGNGWYRCTMTATLAAGSNTLAYYLASADNTLTYTGDSVSGFFIWGAQLAQGTSARDYLRTETRLNIPRVDYSLGGCPNILLEPQRTNLALQSSSFDNASWTKSSGVVVTPNAAISPSGVMDADTIDFGAANRFVLQAITGVIGTTYTGTFYIKGVAGQTIIITVAGVDQLFTLDGTWQRLGHSRSASLASVTFALSTFGGATARVVSLWGAQLEAGAYATSYIPTTTASVTRNADSITRNNIFTNGLITASGGTWFVELRNNRVLTRDGFQTGLSLDDNSFLNSIRITNAGTQRVSIFLNWGGTSSTAFTTTADNCKLALKFNGSTLDIFQNGVKVVNATTFAPNISLMQTIRVSPTGIPYFINEMALFPTPLTDAQMSMLTSDIYPTAAAAYASLGLVSESPSCLTSTTTF